MHIKHYALSIYDLANRTISITESKVKIMLLKQSADEYHCKLILVPFGEKQQSGIYCMFQPLNCSEILFIETPRIAGAYPLISST